MRVEWKYLQSLVYSFQTLKAVQLVVVRPSFILMGIQTEADYAVVNQGNLEDS
jgi:hypothetical protein